MNTFVFIILLKGWDIRNHEMFHSKVIKNHACNPNMLFDASNDRTYQTVIQNCLRQGTQNPYKSSKIHSGTFQGLPECISAPLDHQHGDKIVPTDLQMNSTWSSEDLKRRWKSTKLNNKLCNKKVYMFNSSPLICIPAFFKSC